MCGDLVRELAAERVPLAGLYASTTTLYRSVGFEQAGIALTFRAGTSTLGRGSHDLPCREVDPKNWEIFKPLYDARAKSWTGHLDRTRSIWERTMTPRPGMLIHAYAVGDPMEGYVVFQQTPLETRWFDVRIRDCVFATPAAAQRILALLSDLRALARWVEWTGVGSDPLVTLLPERTTEIIANERWMLRILDVQRALEQRGWPPLSCEIHLCIRDRLLPANDGPFVLRIDGGVAKVERGGRGEVAMDIRALAAMYTGFAHPVAMMGAGLLEGDASKLATSFAGPEPWCCDHY
jgi:predicted acetyltransferase